MAPIDMKALLEAGVHFGHRTQKWDPRMKPYIFTERNGIHIIDLQQTVKALEEAYKLVREAVAEGKTIMFVGTKRQAVETIEAEAQRAGMPYVTVRWLGGMLTNWSTMRQRISELDTLERMAQQAPAEGEASSKLKLTKREMLTNSRKAEKLQERFGGIRNMNRVPDLLFVVDVNREETAVREANILGIPVVGLVDTNCNPSVIDYVIPSNDDAIRAIKLMVSYIADAALEGASLRNDKQDAEPAKVEPKTAAPRRREDGEVTELADDALLGEATLAKVAEEQAKEAQKAGSGEAKPAVKKPAAGAPAPKARKPKLKKSDLQGEGEDEAEAEAETETENETETEAPAEAPKETEE
ncbi:MAG: 30S ribosomal protein S2 [Anaerolineales bacterium]|nr:30S ribosomal protein S2 [Anaerolineales bacterium]